MAIRDFSGFQAFTQRMVEITTGVWARVFAVYQLDADGNPVATPALGRANASASYPAALSVEDKAALDAAKANYTINGGAYVNNTARAAGAGILANISTAGTATLTFGGADVPFTFVVGPTILPLAITKTVLGTAVGTFYAIS